MNLRPAILRWFVLNFVLCGVLFFCQNVESQATSLLYRFTVRDVMPCACMKPGDIERCWININSTQNATLPRRINNPSFCPIRQDILEGKYSRSCDFEIHPNVYANGCSGDHRSMLSDPSLPRFTTLLGGASCTLEAPFSPVSRIVLNSLEYDTSGIPKPIYCSRNNTGPFNEFYSPTDKRCGWDVTKIPAARAVVSTSGEDQFRTWFRDDPKFSKRVAVTRVLTPVPGRPGEFIYDSGAAGFHPLDEHPPCNAVAGRLNCTNGGRVFPKSLLEGETHWDSSNPFTDEVALNKSFSFTVETHNFFTFRGNEIFNFTGDDDVWVFVNERLAVDVGGLHPPAPGIINLTNPLIQTSLGIEVGNTYAVDVYMAERHSELSNFRLSTSLSPGCNIENSGKVAYTWSLANISSDWKLIGGPSWGIFTGSVIKLVDRTVANAVSYAFLRQQINVGTGFIASFKFQTSIGQGEGFTMTLQRDSIVDLNGGSGGNLGFGNMYNALGVAFDFCVDRDTAPNTCAFKQIRLHHVDLPSQRSSARNFTAKLHQQLWHPNEWNDGRVHQVVVKYYDKSPPWLDVIVDNDLFLQRRGINLEQILGGRNAWIGFTASSGPFLNHDLSVFDVQVLAVSLQDSNATLVPSPSSVPPARANGRDAVNFTIQTRDFCLQNIEFGGFAARGKGLLFPDNATVSGGSDPIPARIVDEGNGQYKYEFTSTRPGNYSVQLWYGEGCFNVSSPTATGCFTYTKNASAVFDVFIAPTIAPFSPDEVDPVPVRFYMGAGISAGILGLLGGLALLMFVRVRNQWRREEPFINAGKLAAMERDIQYEGDEQIEDLQRRLQATMLALQHQRARGGRKDMTKTVEELLVEKGELQEMVRRLRAKARGRDPDAPLNFGARVKQAVMNRDSSARGVSRRMSSLSNRASRMLDTFNPVFAGLSSAFGRSKPPSHSSQVESAESDIPGTMAFTTPPIPPIPPKPPVLPFFARSAPPPVPPKGFGIRTPPPLPDI